MINLVIHPSTLVFSAVQGKSLSDTRSIFIATSLGRHVNWSLSANVSWLTPNLLSGSTEGTLKVGVNTSGLESGLHEGNITIVSSDPTTDPVIVPVTLIVNPDIPVKVVTWKDGKDGAMSVSVDDGQPSGFSELQMNGFKGTYVYNGTTPPSFYSSYYNAGMELGSHLVNHTCDILPDYILRTKEIEPNILGLCTNTPQPCEDVITLVWTCGTSNYLMQSVASEYFLSARGYNSNQLEDATPENFMNLKSFNTHGNSPLPPADLKTVVDAAITQKKWFNMVLHNITNDDGAINYAASKNIWVTSIAEVVKYILQRDRFILTNYSVSADLMSFDASRLAIPPSALKNFEASFHPNDSTTLQIDVDDTRFIESVKVDDAVNPYQTKVLNGNIVLLTNVRLESAIIKTVEIRYSSEPRLIFNPESLNFTTVIGTNPANQTLDLKAFPESLTWTVTVDGSQPSWLNVTPSSGTGNGTLIVSANCTGLAEGTYNKTITITSDALGSPQEVDVNLVVNGPKLAVSPVVLSFNASINSPAPSNQIISINNSGTPDALAWSSVVDVPWLIVTPQNGATPGNIEVSVNQAGLEMGKYYGIITLSSSGVANSPQLVNVVLTVNPEGILHYDFNYNDRTSLLTDGWDFIARTPAGGSRNTEQTSGAMVSFDQQAHPGTLRIPADIGELFEGSNSSRNSLFRDLPSGWTSIRLKISSFAPTQNYQEAGLLAYQDDNNYIFINRIFSDGNRVSMENEIAGHFVQISAPNESATSNLYLRLDRDPATETITSYYSLDGSVWTPALGSVIQTLNNPRLAIVVGASPGGFPIADIAWAEVIYSNSKSASAGISLQKTNLELQEEFFEQVNRLHQNYPNPFSTNTWIEFDLAEDTDVTLEIYSSQGHKIETVVSQYMRSGNHKLIWNSRNYPSGTYFLSLKTNIFIDRIKIVKIK